MAQTIITAIIGGIVSLMFWHVEKKIDKFEKESESHHKEQVAIRKAERELMLALADTVALTGKKVEDAASVNGELKASINRTQEKMEKVQEITREIAFEHLEE